MTIEDVDKHSEEHNEAIFTGFNGQPQTFKEEFLEIMEMSKRTKALIAKGEEILKKLTEQ